MKNLQKLPEDTNLKCCKKVQHSARNYGKTYQSVCGKKATYTNGSYNFCRHHSKVGRYVVRVGDIGEILARYDTEKELRDNIYLFPNANMQKVTKSHRRDIF